MRRITLLSLTLLACTPAGTVGPQGFDDADPALDADDAASDGATPTIDVFDAAPPEASMDAMVDATVMDRAQPNDLADDVVIDRAAPPVDGASDGARDVPDAAAPDVPVADASVDSGARDGSASDAGPTTFPSGIGAGFTTALAPERRVTCGTPSMDAPRVTPGATDRYVLRGRIVTPAGVLAPGEVLVQGTTIACVAARCDGNAAYAGATVIETSGVVYPGLVNTHDHPQYDFLPPWTPPTRYLNSDQWQAATAYRAVTEPLRNNESAHTCAMLKWGELRAIVSGTTSVQGALNRVCATRTLARNLEYGTDFAGVDTHRTNTLGIASLTAADAVSLRTAIDSGTVSAYMLHLSEGIDEGAWREWGILNSRNLLTGALMIIHGTALGRTEFNALASVRARLVWSPRSNMVLYGRTTDVGAALDAGLLVALAPDWTPTGSPNLLQEMRYAREFSRSVMGGRLTARDLFEMATSRAAQAADRTQVGSIAVGRYADLMVVPDRGCDAYDTLLDAPVADVRFVMLGGRPMYGDAALMDALPAAARPRCEAMRACGQEKRVCVALADTTNELDRTMAQIETELSAFSTPYALVPTCPP